MNLSYVHASISPSSLKGFQPPVIEEHIGRDSLYIYVISMLGHLDCCKSLVRTCKGERRKKARQNVKMTLTSFFICDFSYSELLESATFERTRRRCLQGSVHTSPIHNKTIDASLFPAESVGNLYITCSMHS